MRTNHWGTRVFVLAVLFLGTSVGALARQSQGSVADAARRAREEKQKKAQAKPDKVFTNDNVPKAPDFSIGPGTAAGESGAPAAAGGESDSAAVAQDRDKAQADLQAREERLARLKTELNLLERDYSLNREQVTSTSGAPTAAAGKAALSAQETEMATKRAEIQTLEQEIAALKQRVGSLTEAAGPVTKGPPTPEQQRKEWTDKLAPLRQQLADVEAELSSMRSGAGQMGDTRMPAGSFTADRIRQLETRRTELQRQISEIEADARRAGVRPQ